MDGGIIEDVTITSPNIAGDGDRDRLASNLGALDGVRDVEVNTDAHTVTISYDPTIVNAPRLQAEVERAGYTSDTAGDRGGEEAAGAYLGAEMNRADQPSDRTTAGEAGGAAPVAGTTGGSDAGATPGTGPIGGAAPGIGPAGVGAAPGGRPDVTG